MAETKKVNFKSIWVVLLNSIKGFSDDKVTKLSASLSYATLFSLTPLAIILISIAVRIFGDSAEGQIYSQLKSYLGSDIALSVQNIIQNASLDPQSGLKMVIGIATMIVGATSVFGEVQSSLNVIWGIKPKPKKGWVKMIVNRLLSFSLIVSIGFLLIVSLSVSTLIDALSDRLMLFFPDGTVWFVTIINFILNFIVVGVLFVLMFKILPDAKIKYKDVMVGAIVTTALFMLGKFLISLYLSTTSIGTTFGAAGSIVMLMVWVYYSALILYFGAEFTKSWALELGGKIYPDEYAVSTKIVEVQQYNKPVEAINKTELDETKAPQEQKEEIKDAVKKIEKTEEKIKNKDA